MDLSFLRKYGIDIPDYDKLDELQQSLVRGIRYFDEKAAPLEEPLERYHNAVKSLHKQIYCKHEFEPHPYEEHCVLCKKCGLIK